MYDIIWTLIGSRLSLEWLGSVDEEIVSSVAEDIAKLCCLEQSISWGLLMAELSSAAEIRLFAGLISLTSLLSSNFELNLPGLDLTTDFFCGAINFWSSTIGARELPAVLIMDWSWSITSTLGCWMPPEIDASIETPFFVFIILTLWWSRKDLKWLQCDRCSMQIFLSHREVAFDLLAVDGAAIITLFIHEIVWRL